MSLLKRLAVACIIVLSLCSAAKAGEESESGWKWRLAPMYLWAVNLQGDATIGPVSAPVNAKFSDVFNNLEGFLSANFEGVHNNRWGFIVDFSWMDISGNQGMATLNFEYIQFEVDGYYRVVTGRQTFDWLLGVRYYSHDLELIPTPVAVSEDWADPVVGARWTTPLAEKWTLSLRGDIGGFGAGSDLSWQAAGFVVFQPWKHVSIFTGVRALGVDYETGSGLDRYEYDVTTWGPVLGVNLKW